MKKFTKVLESKIDKSYRIDATIELMLSAENEGEAGYQADYILAAVDNVETYEILLIDSDVKKVDKKEVEKDPNDLIEKWNSKFSEKEANEFDKYKWFSDMKEEGFKLSDIYELIRKK
jgi:hypothetical protein